MDTHKASEFLKSIKTIAKKLNTILKSEELPEEDKYDLDTTEDDEDADEAGLLKATVEEKRKQHEQEQKRMEKRALKEEKMRMEKEKDIAKAQNAARITEDREIDEVIIDDANYLEIAWIVHKLDLAERSTEAKIYWLNNFDSFVKFVRNRLSDTHDDYASWTIHMSSRECVDSQTVKGGQIHPQIGCISFILRDLVGYLNKGDITKLNKIIAESIRVKFDKFEKNHKETVDDIVINIGEDLKDDAAYVRVVYITQTLADHSKSQAIRYWLLNYHLYIEYLKGKLKNKDNPQITPADFELLRKNQTDGMLKMSSIIPEFSLEQVEQLLQIANDIKAFDQTDTMKAIKDREKELFVHILAKKAITKLKSFVDDS